MTINYLFPNRFKKIGWLLFIPGVLFGALYVIYQNDISYFNAKVFAITKSEIFGDTSFFTISENNILDEISSVLIIVGALLIAFSKEKIEDEFISKIRLESLVWATYVNYLVLMLAVLLVYDIAFFWVLVFNMFTLLIFFLVRFNLVLLQSKNRIKDEK